jgi:3-methyladenine DNA glycosylase Tag
MSIDEKIIRHRKKLENLITKDKEYSKILKQSERLDDLINLKMKIKRGVSK